MNKELDTGAPGQPRGMGWGGRWEGASGWWTHVHLWLIHIKEWQKPLQYCKVISLQLKQINFFKKELDPGMIKLDVGARKTDSSDWYREPVQCVVKGKSV